MKLHRGLSIVVLLVCLGSLFADRNTAADPNDDSDAAKVYSKMIWTDRGTLTPSQIYFGVASESSDPVAKMPAPPFSHFETDDQANKFTPKCYVTDANGVKWTLKFTDQSHSDVASPRIAWALGFGVDETYYVSGGVIKGVTKTTFRGKASPFVKADGSFPEARFKRHPEHHLKDANGNDVFWDESENPGVPQQQLNGLKVLDIMVLNWDAQPKNCEILKGKHHDGADWYIMSDWGKTFGNPAKQTKWDLGEYQKTPFILGVDDKYVTFNYDAALLREAADHRKIPIADVQWFRSLVDKLNDDDIRAAFNAGVATPKLTAAYAAGDITQVNSLTTTQVNDFVAAFRRRINELDTKVPAAP